MDKVSLTYLIETAQDYLSNEAIAQLKSAYTFAETAHGSQQRSSGEAYITHPLAAACILAEYHLDETTLMAALLHDIAEDTSVEINEIAKRFGKEVAGLVDGVTKLGKVRLKTSWQTAYRGYHTEHGGENFESYDRHIETLRKMFLAMSQDIRVTLIKLADRLHNMETLAALPTQRQRRIAKETLELYAPLANRLGIGEIRGRLEDLAFPYAHPEDYQWLKTALGGELQKRTRSVERVRRVLLRRLSSHGLKAEAHIRIKHLYSLWRKLSRHDGDLTKIYDLVAARVIVPTVEDCYRVLGIIHQMWKPLPGRIKDYIATPKPNGYQSLHTTVFTLGGRITEIQIRTPAMHHWAELGIAAHWAYKERIPNPTSQSAKLLSRRALPKEKLTWLQELAKLEETLTDPDEWRKGLRLDFFQDRIFVFTPIGDVLDLPKDATAIDVAFAIHSDLGHHCTGAKANGKIVPISHHLQNGDIVEILTSAKAKPKTDWLQFVKTSRARNLIKRALYGH
jgi:GTP pyrophosphokinase